MANDQDNTSDSLDVTVTDVPESLLDYVISNFVDSLNEAKTAKKISAKIHHVEGQSPKLVVNIGDETARQTISSRGKSDTKGTKTILVKNVPTSADEELLEIFFESTKKQGGGPVQNVKILRDKHVAFVEFCDRASVERVMTKRPIKLGTTVLDIEPYGSLLQGSEKINRMDVIGLPATFTDGLLKVQLDSLLSTQDPNAGYQLQSSTTLVSCTPSNVRVPNLNLGPQLQSSTPVVRGNPSNARAPNLNPGPQCRTSTPVVRRDPPTAQAPTPNPGSKPQPSTTVFRDIRAAPDPYHYDENGSTINVGSRVVRGRGWRRGNEDDGGEGTVTGIDSLLGLVKVRWDSGNIVQYNFGPYGRYVVKLAP